MKIKVSEATPLQLDWLVASIEGVRHSSHASSVHYHSPTRLWSQGGPIIERLMLEKRLVLRCWVEKGCCEASLDFPYRFSYGPTPLIAAMRCYVVSKFGDTVDVPEELS